jgi:hypothetical protein
MQVTQHADADELGPQRLPQKLGAVSKKLCQRAGSAVRSLILHPSKAPTTARATGESQVSTFEARGVTVMF